MSPLSGLEVDWPAVSELLDEALALPAAARADWLASLSGEHARHREALSTLLATEAGIETKNFLDEGPRLNLGDTVSGGALAEGTQVGAYRLIREIGRGGMGTVWLAERSDGLMRRQVALKLPRIVWGDTFAERLGREREILASLEHEHIARLYDAGVDAHGRPFLAMEYVEGEPIDAHCGNRALPARERIGLLLQVMAAVAHAHARLVVHRDLKPGNILVTHEGNVRLLDFGIAKLLEGDRTQRTALTELSGRALTLDYASPEQVRGEPLGTASDVYSLGVVAYELLAEARPYRLKRGTAAEMEEAIAAAEPRLASDAAESPATKKVLRGDLDAILHRALKKDVAERYQSVDAFTQDMQRYLRGEPVLARPDSRRYRAARFLRRNRLAVASASILGLSIMAGGGAAIWQARIARQHERRASAEVTRQIAVRDLYLEAMMRLSLMRGGQPAAKPGPQAVTAALHEVLREMAPRMKGQPEGWEAQLEAVMLQLNYSEEYEASLAVGKEYMAALKAHNAPAYKIIDAYLWLGRDLALLGRDDESEAMRSAGVAWAADTHDARTELSRLNMASDLSRPLIRRGKREEAEAVLMQAEGTASRMFPNEGVRFENLMQLWDFWSDFDDARALQYARRAHAGILAAGTADPEQKAMDLRYLGNALISNGLASDAEAAWRQSLAIYLHQYGRNSAKSIAALGRVADAVSRQGEYDRAAALLSDEARALSTSPAGMPSSAAQLLRSRQLENAWLFGDVPSISSWLASDTPDFQTPEALRNDQLQLIWETRAMTLAGRPREALSLVLAARRAWPEPNRPTSWWIRMLEMQATLQLAAGESANSREVSRSLLAMLEKQRARSGRAYRVAAELAALASVRLGDEADAARSLAVSDAASQPPAFPSQVERAESSLRRAEILLALGRPTDAASAARTALADLTTQHPDSPRLVQARRFAALDAPASRR